MGIFRQVLRPRGPLDKEAEIEGPALEGLVAQHLRTWVLAQKDNYQFSFWRTHTKLEVDFVIYGPKGFWAIEVKRGLDVSPSDVKALSIFQEEYPEATSFLLYRGKMKQKIHNILCIPVEEFLQNLHPEKSLLNF